MNENNIIATIKEDNETTLFEAIEKLNKNGGIVLIDTPVINISKNTKIKLTSCKEGGIVGMRLPNNIFPRLDFKKARDGNQDKNNNGITISGSNQFLKYLIIENSCQKGVYISGNNNNLDHIISRYNNNAGIQISGGAEDNTLDYCYSYRNCDLITYGKNADGFAPKLDSKNTIFNFCYSWDNSDDGWDSFDKEGDNSSSVTYNSCVCWNNGNPDVFTGKFDFDNGKKLDKNMLSIQQLINSDDLFEKNYENNKFSIENGKINGIKASEWLKLANINMSGNGFKLGSKITPKDPNVKRTCDYCAVFDHKNKGFDNNHSEKCTGAFTNCVSFNNRINYKLPYTFTEWNNNWSWGAKQEDIESCSKPIKKPCEKDIDQITKKFYMIRDKIIESVYENKFPDKINFDEVIESLN